MSDPNLISPLLDGFVMGDPISEHNGVRCCPAMNTDSDGRYIVKIISTPATQTQLDALILSGAYPDVASAKNYYKQLADGIVEEINILQNLSKSEGFLGCQDYQVVDMEFGDTGYDVYILTDYRRTLQRQFRRGEMTHLSAINLGLDICSSLSICRRAGYLYVDLKPANIHILNGREYRIGDIGFVRMDSLKYASLPDRCRSEYTAPEVADAFSSLNTTMDVYALGLILYQVYNSGVLPEIKPNEALTPPAYADYEMSEIILKACDPNPENRWQDPAEMGQALVSYMQRNGANDVPIVPPSIPLVEEVQQPEIPAEAPVEEPSAETDEAITEIPDEITEQVADSPIDEPIEEIAETSEDEIEEAVPEDSVAVADEYSEESFENLSFLDDTQDETAEEITAEDIEYQEISEEVSQMMLQIDEIAEHDVPEPVVVPEAVEITLPEPVAESESEDASESEDSSTETEDDTSEDSEGETETPDNMEEDSPSAPPKKKTLRNVLLILLTAVILAAGFLFYKFVYLQSIDEMTVVGNESSLSVSLTTQVDETKLSVVCADAYGNKETKRLTNGKVDFYDLLPGTEYVITVQIDGFHTLMGEYTKTYYTPNQTSIVQLNAVTGAEDGSAIISFTIDGADSEEWKIVYGAEGAETQTQTFTGHTVTISGLTIGQTYTASVSPVNDLYMSGEHSISFTANKLIYAKNLVITSCANNQLLVKWQAPEGVQVDGWSVHCYNDAGYSQTAMTDTTSFTFEGIDDTLDYVVEVSAVGQSVSQRTSVGENAITLNDIVTEITEYGAIKISWQTDAQIPQGGWIISYSVEGTDINQSHTSEANECLIKEAIPGHTYHITILSADETPVVCDPITVVTKTAEEFICSFGGPTITGTDISLSMCKTPDKENWTRNDLSKSDYTTSFASGENASFVIKAKKLYGISDDDLTAVYVITDATGNTVSFSYEEFTWKTLWDYYYGELNLTSMPSAAGEYTVTVYFNGGLVGQETFNIT